MSATASVVDGKIVETASESSLKKNAAKNSMDKEAFLQLLVAQMKYQDPLEPTSNTEFISQYATFAQVEQMQNMAATMELTRASSMVGKLVEVETTDSAGNAKSVQGTVEYVTYENGQAFVSIGGATYSIDDVVAVVDERYQTALELAASFVSAMDELPRLEFLTLEDKDAVETLQKGFNSMTAYQQSFIDKKYIEKLQKYVEMIAELEEASKPAEDENKGDGDETGKVEDGEGGGDDETEGAGESGAVDGGNKTEENEEAGGSEAEGTGEGEEAAGAVI